MLKHVYSYGIDSPIKIRVTAKEAAIYNYVEAAIIKAHNDPKSNRRLNDKQVVLQVPESITNKDLAIFNKVQRLWTDALNNMGRPVYANELTANSLVRN